MRLSRKLVVLGAIAFVMLCGVAVVLWLRPADPGPAVPRQRGIAAHEPPAAGAADWIEIGGVRRPVKDLRAAGQLQPPAAGSPPVGENRVGVSQPVPADANPMVASLVEAQRTRQHPERISSFIHPKPFDADAYRQDPQAYVNVVEPGRVWQPAQPGPGVPRLIHLSRTLVEIEQGETVSLRVKAIPEAPVTFTSFDLGAFQNRLASITVQADAEGIAVARFTGTPGTYNAVNILVASPLTSGQLKFIVNVRVPGLP